MYIEVVMLQTIRATHPLNISCPSHETCHCEAPVNTKHGINHGQGCTHPYCVSRTPLLESCFTLSFVNCMPLCALFEKFWMAIDLNAFDCCNVFIV